MTPAAARSSYRRQFEAHGEPILLRRLVPNGSSIEATALGKISGYQPDELTPGVSQGDQKVLVLVEYLERASFPLPVKAGDKVVWLGQVLNIQFRPVLRRVGTTTVASEMVVR